MNDAQQKIIPETCKHTPKSDRVDRVCPSKLSKRELEDLYFAILDNNIELKRTINGQNEKIKQLSTKVQRFSAAQKTSLGKGEIECCSGSKAVIREQKESIAELKRANERLSERIRILNMRLCSAKQFLGRTSARCNKCCSRTANSIKNSSTSALNFTNKKSTSNLQTTAPSSEFIDKELAMTRTAEVQTCLRDKDNGVKLCDENKCRTLMEEMKQKVVELELELSKTHEEYLTRISRLEQEVLTLQQTKGTERFTLQQSELQAEQLLQRLRAAEALCDDINLQLSFEKRKVSELEARLRAADVSAQVARTIEEHLRNSNLAQPGGKSSQFEVPTTTKVIDLEDPKFPQKHKSADDSGYVDGILLDDAKSPGKEANNEWREKILDLQSQLNSIKRLTVTEKDSEKMIPNIEYKALAIEEDQVSTLRSTNDYSNTMKDSPTVVGPDHLIAGDVFEIKETDVIMAPDGGHDDDCNNNISELNSVHRIPVIEKSYLNLMASDRGAVEKFDQTLKKNEEKVNLDDQRRETIKRHSLGDEEQGVLHYILDRTLPDDKQFTKGEQFTSNDSSIDRKSVKKNNKDECVQMIKNDDTKEECKSKLEERESAGRKTSHDKVPHNIIDTTKKSKSTDETDNREEIKQNDKTVSKVKKKISRDIPDSKLITHSKETKAKTVDENFPSTEMSKPDSNRRGVLSNEKLEKCPRGIKVTEKDDALKGDKTDAGINLPNSEKNDQRKKENILLSKVLLSKTKKKKNSNAVLPGKTREKHSKQSGERAPQSRGSGSAHTYVVRGASPTDTDGEISGLPDLPHETDVANPRNALSPGEEKATTTTTYTETCTSTTDYVTLSEGELPVRNGVRRSSSPGEKKWKNSSGEISPPVTTSQKMEEALQAIGTELARCRELLQHQRPQVTPWTPFM